MANQQQQPREAPRRDDVEVIQRNARGNAVVTSDALERIDPTAMAVYAMAQALIDATNGWPPNPCVLLSVAIEMARHGDMRPSLERIAEAANLGAWSSSPGTWSAWLDAASDLASLVSEHERASGRRGGRGRVQRMDPLWTGVAARIARSPFTPPEKLAAMVL